MFNKDITPQPFWGSCNATSSGRDPLAVQNSSVVIYSSLIVGVTNVTQRVRYLGFYCWLLDTIAKNISAKELNNFDAQIKYIRRAELLLAYIMTETPEFVDVTSVSGSEFTKKHKPEGRLINLALGADLENFAKDLYWKNPMGVFGQYYIGTLLDLGLVCPREEKYKVFRDSTLGDKLAKAYKLSVNDKAAALFSKRVFDGKAYSEDIPKLSLFALHIIHSEAERNFYSRIMSGVDSPRNAPQKHHRINTIKMMLQFINDNKLPMKSVIGAFLQNNFENSLQKNFDVDEESKSWFLYEFNELVHTAFESFHFGLLSQLLDEPQPLNLIFSKIEEGITDLCEQKGLEKMLDFNSLNESIYNVYSRMFTTSYKKDGIERMLDAAQLLYILYQKTHALFNDINDFAYENHFSRKGVACSLLDALIKGKEQMDIKDYVLETVIDAINEHTISSYEKSTVKKGVVNNYIIDDGCIWCIRIPKPIRTSPRLSNVLLYIYDIGWISVEEGSYVLTEAGKQIIKGGNYNDK